MLVPTEAARGMIAWSSSEIEVTDYLQGLGESVVLQVLSLSFRNSGCEA